MLAVWSVVFGVLSITPTALIAWRYQWGWLFGLASQAPWAVYDVVTGQPGFLLIGAVLVPVYWHGWTHRAQRAAQVTTGDIVYRAWCPGCSAPSRVRIPIHVASHPVPAAVVELCAECGRGLLPQHPVVTVTQLRRTLRPDLAVLWWVNRQAQARHGRPARGCAWRDCPRPGWWNCAHITRVDGGTVRWLFCGGRHRRAWARDEWGNVLAGQ